MPTLFECIDDGAMLERLHAASAAALSTARPLKEYVARDARAAGVD